MSRHLALNLAAAGDAVEVWAPKVPAVGSELVEELDGLTVRRIPFALPAFTPHLWGGFAVPTGNAGRALRRAVTAFRPDIVHVQCFGPNGVYATALSALTGLPLVVTLHGETVTNDHDAYARSLLLRSSLRAALRRAVVVTGCSQFALEDAIGRFGLDADRACVIPNGLVLQTPGVAPSAAGAPLHEGSLIVLAVGRLVHNKGFDLLIEAFASVAARFVDVRLVIAGEGPAGHDLRSLAVRQGLAERVTFPGRLNREEVADALAGATVCVMPSRIESFGIVVLEAWRAGTPVIASSRGGAPEFVEDGVTGVLVDPLDVQSLGDALAGLLGDAGLRRRLSDAGRQRVQDFSWEKVTARYRAVYDRCLGRTGPTEVDLGVSDRGPR